MCGEHNGRASAEDNIVQNTKDTPNPRIEIKFPGPPGNRTQAAGLEGRDSTDLNSSHYFFGEFYNTTLFDKYGQSLKICL